VGIAPLLRVYIAESESVACLPPVASKFPLSQKKKAHLHRHRVVVVSAFEHLGHVVEVDAHREVTVAAVVLEPVGAELF